MEKHSLTFVPSGGLANRMRAVASAIHACRATGCPLHVVWFRDWALNARFADIFRPIKAEGMTLREALPADFVLNDRPRRRNLWMPRPIQRMVYDKIIDEQQVTPLKRQGFDFNRWIGEGRNWMSCYQVFGDVPTTLYGELFHPVDNVMQRVQAFESHFSENTIGMHIRRTDNREAIEKSPTQLFIDLGRREQQKNANLRIFLATDSEEVKNDMKRAFGNSLITAEAEASRSSADGLCDGLADMYTLAHTQHIYGTAGSSFSVMAAAIGQVEMTILER